MFVSLAHPLPQLGTLEIIELSFIASVGGDDLLEGKLEDFIIEVCSIVFSSRAVAY